MSYFSKNNFNFIIICILIFILYFCMFHRLDRFENENDTNGMYTAVIVEPRQHKAMELVMKNFTDNLDERWNFIIFHGNQNEEFVRNIINDKLPNQSHRIKLINLNVDNLTSNDYNKLFYDKSLHY